MPRISEAVRYAIITKMPDKRNQKMVVRDLNLCMSTIRKISIKFLETEEMAKSSLVDQAYY